MSKFIYKPECFVQSNCGALIARLNYITKTYLNKMTLKEKRALLSIATEIEENDCLLPFYKRDQMHNKLTIVLINCKQR